MTDPNAAVLAALAAVQADIASLETSLATFSTDVSDELSAIIGPTVTAVTPAIGHTAGGDSVTITGTGFKASHVYFGTTAATSVTIVSDTEITAVTPAGIAGASDVTVVVGEVTSADGTADEFTYSATPYITNLSTDATSEPPYTISYTGGNIFVTGAGFADATGVSVGSVVCGTTSGEPQWFGGPAYGGNDNDIQVTLTAGSSDLIGTTVYVTVTTPEGTTANTPACALTYTE